MKLKHYELICLFLALFLGYEYMIYNKFFEAKSLIEMFTTSFFPQYKINLDPTPGHPLSYFLGWLGFGIMATTNFYIIRKRSNLFRSIGKLNGWLEFHIFCGMLGPILIVFHSNFKVEGLVSISFWSMIVCSTSGVIGRYFYVQTLRKKDELRKYIESLKNQLIDKHRNLFSDEKFNEIFEYAYDIAGAKKGITNPLNVFFSSLAADIKFIFNNPGKTYGLSKADGQILKQIGIENRRIIFLAPFNQLLGYWHSFHLPFAFFMYLVAIIHIIAALLFGVKH